ncbi:phosphohistidine phosphatase SixA [Curvibacter sp. CHRR-16]|uniref:phosphohistidine phosphatase SixA n=1 Tax=Curvibacter sp. CHRR-16 TaxID=2835872 RepID=UPI001BDA78B7|nr:phosphohistidine phosphatase SixA [Curvibacter sp. CHRR-16]MBT0570834.1 phosphohistidine phosphatase SixA [Curvibacter sp. CHRR-16]
MDLILWRHAEAVDVELVGDDFVRYLTPKGEKQAARMAAWLDRQLPEGARILVSPATRAQQTARALDRKTKTVPALAPLGTAEELLELVQWPHARGTVVVVGHQPTLGRVVSQLLGLQAAECSVRKGSIWWLRHRERDGQATTLVLTVQTPELL